uniref:Uncharacterized protein n=1 Tax=Alexandrium monilatum TaxID=311494 RepID=A0A7S4RZE7_9DINO
MDAQHLERTGPPTLPLFQAMQRAAQHFQARHRSPRGTRRGAEDAPASPRWTAPSRPAHLRPAPKVYVAPSDTAFALRDTHIAQNGSAVIGDDQAEHACEHACRRPGA